MTKRKSQKSQSRKQETIFSGTNKLANTAIKAYKVGGMSLVLVVAGLIGLILTILFKSTFDTITFIAFIVICILLFLGGIFVYLVENKFF